MRRNEDGTASTSLDPAVFVSAGEQASTQVVGYGPLHVNIRLAAAHRRVDMTLIQGSPLIELTAEQGLDLRIPGAPQRLPEGPVRSIRFTTSSGEWMLGGDAELTASVHGDVIRVIPGPGGRLVLGPLPTGTDRSYELLVLAIAKHPLLTTDERIEVAPDGATTQILRQVRATSGGSNPPSLWALQPHHQQFALEPGPTLGTVPSALGPRPIVSRSELRLRFPAVPVLWSAVPLPGTEPPTHLDEPVEAEGNGSYFAGKRAYTYAASGETLRLAGRSESARIATDEAKRLLAALRSNTESPSIRWEPGWGSVVVDPAEFGSDTELNDHQLQYGYWVAAASLLADTDPAAAGEYRSLIDLLIADYAGAATVPDAPTSLPGQRTWSAYEGHSWASGTAPFADGNNLESVSESSFSWWAAARWFISTGRPSDAAVFVGRFTIESALAGFYWLPTRSHLPTNPSQRPWTGVVWSGKTDLGTWFDASPEAALGIRLLPLGPASLARYPSGDEQSAANARWRWCEDHGGGCTARWANLLDSDAAVAGRPPLTGGDPEPSTTPAVAGWWRSLWERSKVAEGWTCSPGAVTRTTLDGEIVILASNPGPRAAEMTCWDRSGRARWTGQLEPAAIATIRVDDPKPSSRAEGGR